MMYSDHLCFTPAITQPPETKKLGALQRFITNAIIWPKQNWSPARTGRLLAKSICSSFSPGFLHSLELGLELFARVFVIDAWREPNVIERRSAIGVG